MMVITPSGITQMQTGGSKIKHDRPLCSFDGTFLDENSGKYLSLDQILHEYLAAVPELLNHFKTLYKK